MQKLNKITAALLFTASMAVSAIAAPVEYNLDSSHSFPRFSYSHMGLSTQLSRFNHTTGTVVFDKAAKTGSVDVVIDINSVDTGFDVFNGHIKGEDFFNAAQFPSATFKSTKVTFEGDQPVSVDGDLTIKGITKPVTLKLTHFVSTVHPMAKKEAIGADATVVIKRSDYNMAKYVPYVSDEVTITISLEAIAK